MYPRPRSGSGRPGMLTNGTSAERLANATTVLGIFHGGSVVSRRLFRSFLLFAGLTVLFACGPSQPVRTGAGPDQTTAAGAAPPRGRTLALVGRSEIPSLSARPLQSLGLTSETTVRLFNAGLAYPNDRGIAQPYLAERLPVLNSDGWRVSPDGHMETTYKLRSGLTWQDGAP